jgi:hypothetical protein
MSIYQNEHFYKFLLYWAYTIVVMKKWILKEYAFNFNSTTIFSGLIIIHDWYCQFSSNILWTTYPHFLIDPHQDRSIQKLGYTKWIGYISFILKKLQNTETNGKYICKGRNGLVFHFKHINIICLINNTEEDQEEGGKKCNIIRIDSSSYPGSGGGDGNFVG